MAIREQATRKPVDFAAQVAQKQAEVRANVAAKAAAKPVGIADGLTVTNATEGEFAAARARAAQAGPRAVPNAAPAAAAAPTARVVSPATLTRAEANSFNTQSQGRFGQAFPEAAATPPSTRMPTGTGAGPNVSVPRAVPGIADGLPGMETRMGMADQARAMGRTARAGEIGQRAGAAFAKAAPTLRKLGKAGAVVGVGMEGLDVARTIADPNASKLDVGTQVAEGAGKLATAGLGAELGAGIGAFGGPLAPITVPVGAIAGGIAGYAGGEKLIHKVRGMFGSDESSPAERAQAAGAQAANPAAAAAPDFSNVVGHADSMHADQAERDKRQHDNDGITPVGDRTGDANEVLGIYNGRKITRGESDRLSGSASFGGTSTPSIADGLATATPRGGMPSADFSGAGSEARVRDIADPSSAAGKLYAQLAADKTPTGKRVAAQFLEGYVGAGTQELGQRRGLAGDQIGAQSQIQRGREGDASQLQQEQVRAKSGNKGQPQYIFNDDGSIGQISDGVLSAVSDASGKPAKASKGKVSAKDQEALITERLNQIDPGNTMTADERKQERAAILQELAASLGAGNGA